MEFSILIPTYNDSKFLKKIISECLKFRGENKDTEIIVIDDGSKPGISIDSNSVKIIRHEINKGKTGAIKTGVDNSKGKYLIFIDADLQGFGINHLRDLTSKMLEGYDMVIGDREIEHPLGLLTGFSTAYSGERILKREILVKNYKKIFTANTKNYAIEPAINKLFFRLKTTSVLLKGLEQTHKTKKVGLVRGTAGYIKCTLDYYNYLGAIEYLYQLKVGKKLRNENKD